MLAWGASCTKVLALGSWLGCPGEGTRGCEEDGSRFLPSGGHCHLLDLPDEKAEIGSGEQVADTE